MTLEEFRASFKEDRPPAALSPALRALWLDYKGNWDAAHALVQNEASTECAWVHAYLHRKEGDVSNASYWYAACGRERAGGCLEDEREHLLVCLLQLKV